MQIIVTGSLAFDFIMDFPGKFSDHILPEKIHEINLSFLVKTLNKQRGGTAGNIAYNLALLGLKPTILATAGYDFSDYKKFLENAGVDTSMIYIIEAEPTASAFIFTDMVDNQITGFYPGAMNAADKLKIKNDKLKINKNDFVVISPNNPVAMMKLVEECWQLKLDYMFDPGMQLPRLSDGDLKQGICGAKIVIGNDYEMALIKTRLKDTSDGVRSTPPRWRDKAANSFTIRGVPSGHLGGVPLAAGQIWITTLGEHGSIIETGGKKYNIPPARPKGVLDPTGAGDAFRAGFLAGFLRGLPLEVCGKIGSVCSVYTVEKYGTTTHKFTKTEFYQRYKANFREELKW